MTTLYGISKRYRVSIADATDVSGTARLASAVAVRPAQKHLLLDLSDVKDLSQALTGFGGLNSDKAKRP